MSSGSKPGIRSKEDLGVNCLTLIKLERINSLYYGVDFRVYAEIAKRYGGRLENGYAQACGGSNPSLGVLFVTCVVAVCGVIL